MRVQQPIRTILALLIVAGVATGATLWFTRSGDHAATVEGFSRSDERHMTVRVTVGEGDTITLARFEEHGSDIVVTVRLRSPSGPRNDIGLPYQITATLVAPIGVRTIVDGSSGATIQELRAGSTTPGN